MAHQKFGGDSTVVYEYPILQCYVELVHIIKNYHKPQNYQFMKITSYKDTRITVLS